MVKHEIKRNIYACISIGGLVTYDIFKENMNSDKYIEILEDKFIDIYKNNNNYVYQQDNSPIHKSNKTSEYLKKNNVTLMNWPANSPYLNPIVNLWYLLKYKLYGMLIAC